MMNRRKASDFREYQHGHIDRRSFLNGAGRFALGALTVGAVFEMMRPNCAWAQQVAKVTHPASARVLDRLRTRFTFQISVDVATLEQGLGVAGAALAGGVNIVEIGTPLLKNEGVSNVVPAFRRKFPEALLLADMKSGLRRPASAASYATRLTAANAAVDRGGRVVMSPRTYSRVGNQIREWLRRVESLRQAA
jgi:hypothetical protein